MRFSRLSSPVRLLVITAAAATLATLSPGAAMASGHDTAAVEWSVAPADATGEDGRISLRHVADPGTTVTDRIAVTNHSSATAEFTVHAGDGVLGADGAFDIRDGEATASGAWIGIDGLADGRIALAGGETRVLPVEITVPADATPGDHPAGIVVGLSQQADDVTVTHRIGVRVHLQVAGDVAAGLTVADAHATFTPSWIPFAPGTLVVDLEVHNTGNVRVGAAPAVAAAGVFGLGQSRSADAAAELLPGDSVRQSVELTAWPLAALFGGVTVSGSSIGADSIPLPEPASADFAVPAVSWTGIAVIVLLVLVTVLIIRRRRKLKAADENGGRPAQAPVA